MTRNEYPLIGAGHLRLILDDEADSQGGGRGFDAATNLAARVGLPGNAGVLSGVDMEDRCVVRGQGGIISFPCWL